MTLVMNRARGTPSTQSARLLFALYTLALAHIIEAGLYALGFSFGELIGIGGFEQENIDTFMDVFYFSWSTIRPSASAISIPRTICVFWPVPRP